jgi:hypothetical protein
MTDSKPLTPEECHEKVGECRDMAKCAVDPSHRIMLGHDGSKQASTRLSEVSR